MLKVRTMTALALLAPFLAALFYLPEPYWGLLVLAVTVLASLEWSRFCGYPRIAALAYGAGTGALGAALLWWPAGSAVQAPLPWLLTATVFWVLLVPVWLALRWQLKNPVVLWMVGWIVLIPTAFALVLMRGVSSLAVLSVLALVWIADSAAYFAGRAWGRRKLAPAISPGKTWEGVIGALAGITVYGLALSHFASMSLWIVPGFWALTALSIVGDLFESFMKRQAGRKDSGGLLPGHGGILDRIDSLTSTLPVAALFMLYAQAQI